MIFYFSFEIVQDLQEKMAEIEEMSKNIRECAQVRDKSLTSAKRLSEKFYDLSTDVLSGLRDLKDSMYSQEPPGVDPEAIKEQQAELAVSSTGQLDFSEVKFELWECIDSLF